MPQPQATTIGRQQTPPSAHSRMRFPDAEGPKPYRRFILIISCLTLLSIWAVALYTLKLASSRIERTLTDQQVSAANIVAAQIHDEIESRFKRLSILSTHMKPVLLQSPPTVQAFLNDRTSIGDIFNLGVVVINRKGISIADYPQRPGRIGQDYSNDSFVRQALEQGIQSISRPLISENTRKPNFHMVVPIRDSANRITGCIMGIVDLNLPNFLDKITLGRFGKASDFLLISSEYRLVITASDEHRVMETLPPATEAPALDQILNGTDGIHDFINPQGLHVLNASATVAHTGWRVVISTPYEEAFADTTYLRQHTLLGAGLSTLLILFIAAAFIRMQNTATLAFLDPLTQLANRRLLDDRVDQAAFAALRRQEQLAAIVLDLDAFKPLNDLHGHAAGDLLLKEAARRLQDCVRAADTVARTGGDEFVILMVGLDKSTEQAREEAWVLAENIHRRMREPYALKIVRPGAPDQWIEYRCTASLGIALTTGEPITGTELLQRADSAMYLAKQRGRDRIECFETVESPPPSAPPVTGQYTG